ncbi:CpaF family protein [Schaalia sp. ZJ405]|uniref:CpaF family protein n=1 Tax=Schaalia sp. ZJ405 TaxID=2709403 RepID=UPI0013EE1723|nr:ATPase, T2SS/T4P/T4SS family [Schaalia sp. ZJ405]QPK80843.1 CpaF family protein [Schaalia sp. ZJ405]
MGYERHIEWIRHALASRDIEAVTRTEQMRLIVEEAVDAFSGPVDRLQRQQHVDAILTQITGLGPIQGLIDDPDVEEIWINSGTRVFVARGGKPELTSLILSESNVRLLVERMLHHSGRRVDLSQPFVDAMLASGERLHVVIPPVTGTSWVVNIRKHLHATRTLQDLQSAGMCSPPMAEFLHASVVAGLSIVVSGATQAGKTTVLRALAGEIPRVRRVISCEEVFELGLTNWDCVALQTRPGNLEGKGEISLRDLVRETLRMRPECLIVGEVRGPEALDLLLALNAGIPGLATIHANSARQACEKIALLSLLAGENVTRDFVVPTVADSVDLVCHVDRDPHGERRITQIVSVGRKNTGHGFATEQLWAWNGEDFVRGQGSLDCAERFAAVGIPLDEVLPDPQGHDESQRCRAYADPMGRPVP